MLVISVVCITYYCYTGEAFQDFIAVMRQFPTKINKQQLLVDYTMDVILQNCEIGELENIFPEFPMMFINYSANSELLFITQSKVL